MILEGESLFNDATALLIYRVGLAIAVGTWMGWTDVPWLAVSLMGGVALGLTLGKVFPLLVKRQSETWPEFHQRFVQWVEPAKAVSMTRDSHLKKLVARFAKRVAAAASKTILRNCLMDNQPDRRSLPSSMIRLGMRSPLASSTG